MPARISFRLFVLAWNFVPEWKCQSFVKLSMWTGLFSFRGGTNIQRMWNTTGLRIINSCRPENVHANRRQIGTHVKELLVTQPFIMSITRFEIWLVSLLLGISQLFWYHSVAYGVLILLVYDLCILHQNFEIRSRMPTLTPKTWSVTPTNLHLNSTPKTSPITKSDKNSYSTYDWNGKVWFERTEMIFTLPETNACVARTCWKWKRYQNKRNPQLLQTGKRNQRATCSTFDLMYNLY